MGGARYDPTCNNFSGLTLSPARPRTSAGAILLAAIIGALLAGAGVLGVIRYAPEQLGLAVSSNADAGNKAVLTQQLADVSTRLAELQQQVYIPAEAAGRYRPGR